LRRHDGAWRWAVDSGTPRFAEDGSFLGYIGSVIDITERKEMEHALRESEDQLARAQRAAGIGSWNWEPPTGTTSFSGEYFALHGLAREHDPFTLEAWLACIHPEDRARVDREMQHALQERGTLDIQFRVVWPDGSVHWLAGKGTVFCDDRGQPVRFTGVNFDITSRKEAEQELMRTNEDLKQFAFAASHYLQEPLRIVINYTQLLERRYKAQLDDRAAKIIETAVDAALRMERLLRGLRDYWQVSDRQAIQITNVDLNDVLARTLTDLRAAIAEADAVVTHDTLPVVSAADTPMMQIFQNLIANALKYRSPERQSRIHVSSEQTATEHVITISDNGIGIDPKYAGQVFGLFKRLHGQEYSGSGLGLSICQKIVERFGGRIWVEPNNGSGAAFRFTLPVRSSG
jgi:PAS domain S-box-containing protein